MSEPVRGPDDLTALQRKVLRNYREYCDQTPTLSTLLIKSLPVLSLLVIYIVVAGGLMLFVDMGNAALFLWGMGAGVLLHQVSVFRVFLRVWPAVAAIVDRQRLDELLDEPPETSPDRWS